MSFGRLNPGRRAQPMSEINVTPLVDVMLVLLVIFIVAAPLLTHSVKLELPKATAQPSESQPDAIQLSLDAEGVLHWNGQALSREEAAARFAVEGAKPVPPQVRFSVDASIPYRRVAETLADAARVGVNKIGLVTAPEAPATATARP